MRCSINSALEALPCVGAGLASAIAEMLETTVASSERSVSIRSLVRNLPAEPDIKMDVSEDEQGYHVKAEVPGVKKEDIQVAVEDNQVSITAEIKKEKEDKQGETMLLSERYYGMQSRSFTLMHDVDQSKAEAKYRDGILELTLPKKSNGGGMKQVTVK